MATTGDDFGIYFEEFVPSEDESEKSFELLPRPPISQRNIIEELEMPDLPLRTSSIDNVETQPVTSNFISSGTSKGRPLVSSSDGYTYTKVRTVKGTSYWQCSKRNSFRAARCPATVKCKDGDFIPGKKRYSHDPDFADLPKRIVYRDSKREGLNDLYKPAQAIAEKNLSPVFENDIKDLPNTPKPRNIARATNRQRQSARPSDPTDLSFAIDEIAVDGFLKADVKCEHNRHLIFATDTQLFYLAEARRWYGDGTFKIVKHPFVQLYTIHAFVKKGDATKQVPLVFIFMSGKSYEDYRTVFNCLTGLFPHQANVAEIVLDYEAAAWKAVRHVFPNVSIKGCSFHLNQAIYKKIQELGLSLLYLNDEST